MRSWIFFVADKKDVAEMVLKMVELCAHNKNEKGRKVVEMLNKTLCDQMMCMTKQPLEKQKEKYNELRKMFVWFSNLITKDDHLLTYHAYIKKRTDNSEKQTVQKAI